MKKIPLSLFLLSVFLFPVLVFAQEGMKMIEENLHYIFHHDLSNYETCCFKIRATGEIIACLKDGMDIWHYHPSNPDIGLRLDGTTWENGKILDHCVLVDKILTIGDWIFTAILVVAIIIFLLAAWGFLTSQGDPNKVKTARNFVIYAIIGIAVAFLAKALVRVVASVMT